MEIKPIMKHILMYTVLIIVYFILQISVFPYLALGGIMPNILIILVSTIGLTKGGNTAIVIGVICGFLLDLFSGTYLGMYAFIYLIVGFLNSLFQRWFFGDDLKLPLILIGVSDLTYGCLLYGCVYLLRGRYDFTYYFLNIIMPEAVYTVLVSIVLYFPICYCLRKAENSDKRSEHRIG